MKLGELDYHRCATEETAEAFVRSRLRELFNRWQKSILHVYKRTWSQCIAALSSFFFFLSFVLV